MANNHHQEGERVKTISDMLEQKVSYVEVGKRLGISKARVGQIALAHGLGKTTKGAQRPLSQRQAQILAFIRGFAADNSYPPTVREVAKGCNLSSTAVATYNLSHLVEKGYLRRVPGIARGLVLTEQGKEAPLD